MLQTVRGLWFAWLIGTLLPALAPAASLQPAVVAKIQAATFEVVMKKPEGDVRTYERPLPLDQLPFTERNDKYLSIGTAFAIGDNRYVTAAHVLSPGFKTQYGEPALRGTDGAVHAIDQILQYSGAQDFVVLSLKDKLKIAPLVANREPVLNETVFAVGNALGEGIVIRDGLFTSQTPEQRQGEWKWIRFSAAASPGNSGGPLLDTKGRVIGVVLRKSQNENLNFAAPIALVLDAPAKAITRTQIRYRIPVMDVWESGEYVQDFPLPRPFAEAAKEIDAGMQTFFVQLKERLLQKNADSLFPNGNGSQALLSQLPEVDSLGLLYRKDDGNWEVYTAREPVSAQLEGNGFVEYGGMMRKVFSKMRRPDNVAPDVFYGDSKYFLDTYLKVINISRRIGTEDIKITSYGKATRESVVTDAYGRKWQLRMWDVAQDDHVMIVALLPVPDGYLAIMDGPRTGDVEDTLRDFETMMSFSYPQYMGTLRQWQEFLSRKELLPAALADATLTAPADGTFKFTAKRFTLEIPQKVQRTTAESLLSLTTGFVQDGPKVVWDIAGLALIEDLNARQSLAMTRSAKPHSSLPQEYSVDWRAIVDRVHPYNGVAADMSGASVIAATYPYPAAGSLADAKFIYTLSVAKQGAQKQKEMKALLNGVARGLTVTEKEI